MLDKLKRIPKGKSKKDKPGKLTTLDTQDEKYENKTQHDMYWTPLYTNKHK